MYATNSSVSKTISSLYKPSLGPQETLPHVRQYSMW
jgi:hypothetical protein